MKIIRQLIKEFWFPLLGAIAWTIYALNGNDNVEQTKQIKDYITIFGPSFFLISWLTGQFFRVKKQVNVESNLDSIESRVKELLVQLEEHSENLVGHLTGGDSYLYLKPYSAFEWKDGETVFMAAFVLEGRYELREIKIKFINGWVNWIDGEQTFKNVNSKTIGRTFTQIKSLGPGSKAARFQIVFYANTGSWYQDLAISRNGNSFNVVSKVTPAVKGSESPSINEEYTIENVDIAS